MERSMSVSVGRKTMEHELKILSEYFQLYPMGGRPSNSAGMTGVFGRVIPSSCVNGTVIAPAWIRIMPSCRYIWIGIEKGLGRVCGGPRISHRFHLVQTESAFMGGQSAHSGSFRITWGVPLSSTMVESTPYTVLMFSGVMTSCGVPTS